MPRSWEAGVELPGRRRVRAALGRGRLEPLHRRWRASRSLRIDLARGRPRPHHRLREPPRGTAWHGARLPEAPSEDHRQASRLGMGTVSAQSSLSIYAACPVRLPCLLTRPNPRLQFRRSGRRPSPRGSLVIQVIQGQATNPDSIHAELDRWKANSNQAPTAGWDPPPASPTTAASSPWSGLRPRSWPAATATGPSRMPGGARRPSTWPRSPSTTRHECTPIGRAGRTRLALFR
jgi:hypothetical protein